MKYEAKTTFAKKIAEIQGREAEGLQLSCTRDQGRRVSEVNAVPFCSMASSQPIRVKRAGSQARASAASGTEALIELLNACGSVVPERTVNLLRRYELDIPRLLELSDAGWEALGYTDPLQKDYLLAVMRRTSTGASKLLLAQRIPICNFAYDVIHTDSPPTTSHVETLCTTMSLVASLFLSVVTSLPMDVSFGDINAALERFSMPPYSAYPEYGMEVVERLILYTTLSLYALGASLLTNLIILVTMFVTQKVDNEIMIRNEWWRWARYAVVWAFCTLVGGIACAAVALNRAIAIQWPDPYIPGRGFSMLNQNSTFAYSMELGTACLVFFLMGLAKVRADMKSVELAVRSTDQLRNAVRDFCSTSASDFQV